MLRHLLPEEFNCHTTTVSKLQISMWSCVNFSCLYITPNHVQGDREVEEVDCLQVATFAIYVTMFCLLLNKNIELQRGKHE